MESIQSGVEESYNKFSKEGCDSVSVPIPVISQEEWNDNKLIRLGIFDLVKDVRDEAE